MIFGLLLLSFIAASYADETELLPGTVDRCLAQKVVAGQADFVKAVNPFYLRGDFDGDGKPHYAVAVKGKKSGKLRVAMCLGNGRAILLGSEGGAPFSDMPDDNFFAPFWMVYSVNEARKIGQFDSNEPRRLPVIRGEVVVMCWEDGIAAIYWDGAKFRWAGTRH